MEAFVFISALLFAFKCKNPDSIPPFLLSHSTWLSDAETAMATELLWNCALSPPADAHCDITLTESGLQMKKPGQSVRLSCEITGFSLSSDSVHWVRQAPNKGLQWVGYYDGSSDSRFKVTEDSSNSIAYLDITDLQPSDTAEYYCVRATVRELKALLYWNPPRWFNRPYVNWLCCVASVHHTEDICCFCSCPVFPPWSYITHLCCSFINGRWH